MTTETVRRFLRGYEWDKGNGQCSRCGRTGPKFYISGGGWGGHIGHKQGCHFGLMLEEAGMDVLWETTIKLIDQKPDLSDPHTADVWERFCTPDLCKAYWHGGDQHWTRMFENDPI